MPDYVYGQASIAGSVRQRAHTIIIRNPREGVPVIEYQEERIADIGGQVVDLPLPSNGHPRGLLTLRGQVDLQGTIALRSLETGELTGETVPTALIYQALYSDYLTRAFARDSELAES